MTRRGGGGGASGGQMMNNSSAASPAIRSNMPDLLPQTPSGGPPTPVSRGGHENHGGGAGPQGSPLTGLQVRRNLELFRPFSVPVLVLLRLGPITSISFYRVQNLGLELFLLKLCLPFKGF
jgi:hypothetical protein